MVINGPKKENALIHLDGFIDDLKRKNPSGAIGPFNALKANMKARNVYYVGQLTALTDDEIWDIPHRDGGKFYKKHEIEQVFKNALADMGIETGKCSEIQRAAFKLEKRVTSVEIGTRYAENYEVYAFPPDYYDAQLAMMNGLYNVTSLVNVGNLGRLPVEVIWSPETEKNLSETFNEKLAESVLSKAAQSVPLHSTIKGVFNQVTSELLSAVNSMEITKIGAVVQKETANKEIVGLKWTEEAEEKLSKIFSPYAMSYMLISMTNEIQSSAKDSINEAIRTGFSKWEMKF